MRVGLDIDGVVADFQSAIREMAALELGRELPPADRWAIWETWGITQERWDELLAAFTEREGWRWLSPYHSASTYLRSLEDAGHTIYYITARPLAASWMTFEWLDRHGFPCEDVCFYVDKAAAAKNMELDIYIDDHPPTVQAVRGAGIEAYVLDRPWNRDDDEQPRMQSLVEYVHRVKAASSMRKRVFDSGAMRDTDEGKLDYEGFLSPAVLHRFAEYMHKNRFMEDGTVRDSDNWQKGIPKDAYMKSMWRHFMDVWMLHRGVFGGDAIEMDEALCALLFNVQGYLHECLKEL